MPPTQDLSRSGLAYPAGWSTWEGRSTPWPRPRAFYSLIIPGSATLGLLALQRTTSSSLPLLLAPLVIVVLIEAKRHVWNMERGLTELLVLQLPTLLGPLVFLAASRWVPQGFFRGIPFIGLALAGLAVAALLLFGGGPIVLSKDHIYAYPHLTQQQRARPRRLVYLPPALAFAALLGAGVWFGLHGSALAAAVPFLLTLLLVAWPPRIIPRAARTLALYLRAASPIDANLAPGTWSARTPRRARIMAWNTQAMLVSLACAALAPTLIRDASLGTFVSVAGEMPPPLSLQALLMVGACTILLPGVLLLGAYAPALWSLERSKRRFVKEAQSDPRTPWECVVDRLCSSPLEWHDAEGRLIREKDHLLVGFHAESGAPLLLHRAILEEHAYVCGRSGSGKTSRALMPLLIQLVRGRGADDDPPPILVLDLKGDPPLFHTAQAEAERSRPNGTPSQEFRFFTLDSSHPGHRFNPLETFCSRPRQSLELANQLLEALSLDYGDQYGRSFYSGGSREVLEEALREADARTSFETLYERVQENKTSKKFEIRAKLHALSGYQQLQSSPGTPAINMHEALERRQLVYFYLDSSTGAVGAREVARLALFAFLDAAVQRQKEGKPARRAYIIIDEFQVVATVNIQQVVQQARSRGISLILANQSIQDLRVQGTNLLSTVQTNTRFKQFFSVNDAESIREMTAMSGQKVVYMPSFGISSAQAPMGLTETTSTNWNATFRPQLDENVILEASEAEGGAIVHLASSYGMSNFGGAFTPIVAPHCLKVETYLARASAPMPAIESAPIMPQSEKPPRERDEDRERGGDGAVLVPQAPQRLPTDPALEELKLDREGKMRALFDRLEEIERS